MKLLLATLLVSLSAAPAYASAAAMAAERPAAAAEQTIDPNSPGVTAKGDEIVSDGIDIVERLGEQASIDVPLVNQDGKVVRLRDYMGKRPVILALVYYRCPVLCTVLLQGLAKVLQSVDWQAGREFDVLTVSVDPNETTALAKEKRRGYLQALGRQGTEGAWPFFTGSVEAVDALAASVGFKFKYIARERQFAHIAALFFLSPQGKVTRYLYGINYDPKEVKLALFEAGEGRVGTPLERVLLRCFKFDAAGRKYHLFLRTYYRVWGVIIIAFLGTFLGLLWWRDLRRMKLHEAASAVSKDPKGTA